MTSRAAAVGIGLLLLLALLAVGAAMLARGTTQPALTGLFLGIGLGGLNLSLEAFSLSWALRKKPSVLLAVSLGGFGFRLVLVSVLIIVFGQMQESVNVLTFALAYVASFLAFLGLQIWAVSRVQRKPGSPPGEATEEAEL